MVSPTSVGVAALGVKDRGCLVAESPVVTTGGGGSSCLEPVARGVDAPVVGALGCRWGGVVDGVVVRGG